MACGAAPALRKFLAFIALEFSGKGRIALQAEQFSESIYEIPALEGSRTIKPSMADGHTLLNSLDRHAGKELAVCETGATYRYADVLELGTRIQARAVARRLVFCLVTNDAASLLGYLALLYADAVPALLNVNILPDQLARLRNAYRPAFLLVPQSRCSEIDGAREVLQVLDYALLEVTNDTSYKVFDELALLLSTSGSTGSPMFVRQSRKNVVANAESIAQFLGISSHDRPITTLPLSYTYGLSVIHSHLVKGCQFALTTRSFFDREFWDFLKSCRASTFGGVPYHYEILKKLRFWRMDVPSLRTLTQAGGAMHPDLTAEIARECGKRTIRFFVMYGQAEATARMSYLPPERVAEKPGSIGRPIPGGEFWLENDRGERLSSAGATGELVYTGDNVSLGYAEGYADLARGDDNRGVLRTGDLARCDSEGDFYIVGRAKRFIKLFGHRVNLQDLESNLQSAGYQVACSGRDDHLRIYVLLEHATAATGIKARVAELLRIHSTAIAVVGIEQFPRSEAGKLLYSQLDELKAEVLA